MIRLRPALTGAAFAGAVLLTATGAAAVTIGADRAVHPGAVSTYPSRVTDRAEPASAESADPTRSVGPVDTVTSEHARESGETRDPSSDSSTADSESTGAERETTSGEPGDDHGGSTVPGTGAHSSEAGHTAGEASDRPPAGATTTRPESHVAGAHHGD